MAHGNERLLHKLVASDGTCVRETTVEHTGILGGSADTWGRTWSASELSDTNFRVRVLALGGNNRDFFLGWVPVQVHYGP